MSVKDYFRDDPGRLQSRRIVFDKQANALMAAAAGEFLLLVQAAGAGTYFRAAPKRERLHTNSEASGGTSMSRTTMAR